jgi:hypothetical protein
MMIEMANLFETGKPTPTVTSRRAMAGRVLLMPATAARTVERGSLCTPDGQGRGLHVALFAGGFVAVAVALTLAVTGQARAFDVTAAGVLIILLGVPLALTLMELAGLVRRAFGSEHQPRHLRPRSGVRPRQAAARRSARP